MVRPYTVEQPFRFWCQKILPLVYDDSLSYYELLNKVVDYLNKNVDNVNALGDAFNSLQTYVQNYFTNLDVQQEIDNKLDAMVQDGTLDGLIQPLVGDAVSDWLEDNVTPTGSAVVVDASLTISGAAADAKVTGDEISDLKSDLNTHVYNKIIGDNKANPNNSVTGGLASDGSVDATLTAYTVTDFIEISENTDYVLTGWYNVSQISNSRKYVALYDSAKNYIADTYQNVASDAMVTFNSGTAKYCRLASQNNTSKYLSIGTEQPSVYIPYNEQYISVLQYADNTIPSTAVVNNVFSTDINLYDSPTDVVGVLYGNGTLNSTATNYKTTDYIPILSGKSYLISPSLRRFHVYDSNKVSYSDHNTAETDFIFTSPITGYIRISYAVSTQLVSVEEQGIENPTQKIVEGIGLSNTQLKQIEEIVIPTDTSYDILKGKKWAVCGDSFTNSGGTGTTITDGKYVGQAYTYPWIIGNRCDMDIVKFFEGGRTLAFPENPGTFTNSLTNPSATWYYQNIPSDVDYITIYLGINDEHHSSSSSAGDGEDNTGVIPLGTVNDSTTATYLGAWNVVLTWLITNRPNAHIGIIVTNGIASKDEYRLGQIAIAEKYGIPYIDLNGDSRTPAMLRTSNPNIPSTIKTALINKWAVDPSSNTHPNDAAQLFESTFIENFLRSI